jgi:hypothetical protein
LNYPIHTLRCKQGDITGNQGDTFCVGLVRKQGFGSELKVMNIIIPRRPEIQDLGGVELL